MRASTTHTAHKAHSTAALGPALWVLDLGWNGHRVHQSPAQPRTRENDAANNIITALVHISLIWQKSSLSGVSHMVHCSVMARTGGGTNYGILGTFSVRTHGWLALSSCGPNIKLNCTFCSNCLCTKSNYSGIIQKCQIQDKVSMIFLIDWIETNTVPSKVIKILYWVSKYVRTTSQF